MSHSERTKSSKRNREESERFIFTLRVTVNDRLRELTNKICRAHAIGSKRDELNSLGPFERMYYAGEFTGFAAANYTALHSR